MISLPRVGSTVLSPEGPGHTQSRIPNEQVFPTMNTSIYNAFWLRQCEKILAQNLQHHMANIQTVTFNLSNHYGMKEREGS